ncbi:MAG: hypothetical protein AAGC93_30930 [Cyanobacteria bacterium P01_F01_bin.53]
MRIFRLCALLAGILPVCFLEPGMALPGQPTRQVKAWIQGHPTLRPGIGETLVVQKQDTAAKRFIFKASPFSPGNLDSKDSLGMIETETLSFYDKVNGVTLNRLEEALRVIYNAAIHQDYRNAEAILIYPTGPTSISGGLRGEIRVGNQYAYWVEQVINPDGSSHSGQIQVFLKEEVPTMVNNIQRNRQ